MMSYKEPMPRAEDRRRLRLAQLIELEGGLNPPTRKTQPGHYAIAQRVIAFETGEKDFKQMAQSLRQVVRGKINIGPDTVARIEAAYAPEQRHGVYVGWFDDPDGDAELDAEMHSQAAADPGSVVETFGRMFTAWRDLPEEKRGTALAEVERLLAKWSRPKG